MQDGITEQVAPPTYKQIVDEPRPEVESLTEFALVDQPATDRDFVTPSGRRIRVRVVQAGAVAANAPTSTNVALADSSKTLSMSMAVLNEDDTIATDAARKLLSMNRHMVLLSAPMMALGRADIKQVIEKVIRQEAYALEMTIGKRGEADDYLAEEWGGAVNPRQAAKPGPGLTEPTSSITVNEIVAAKVAEGQAAANKDVDPAE